MFELSVRGLLLATARAPCAITADRQGRSFRLRLLDRLRVWDERNRQRHALRLLAEHDDFLLKDIGVSQDEAFRSQVSEKLRSNCKNL